MLYPLSYGRTPTMVKSKNRRRKDKPDKPHPEFPLFAHATKRWAKKIRGRMYYFGPWEDPEGSLDKSFSTARGIIGMLTRTRHCEPEQLLIRRDYFGKNVHWLPLRRSE
jgi:hypothetical protein